MTDKQLSLLVFVARIVLVMLADDPAPGYKQTVRTMLLDKLNEVTTELTYGQSHGP